MKIDNKVYNIEEKKSRKHFHSNIIYFNKLDRYSHFNYCQSILFLCINISWQLNDGNMY